MFSREYRTGSTLQGSQERVNPALLNVGMSKSIYLQLHRQPVPSCAHEPGFLLLLLPGHASVVDLRKQPEPAVPGQHAAPPNGAQPGGSPPLLGACSTREVLPHPQGPACSSTRPHTVTRVLRDAQSNASEREHTQPRAHNPRTPPCTCTSQRASPLPCRHRAHSSHVGAHTLTPHRSSTARFHLRVPGLPHATGAILFPPRGTHGCPPLARTAPWLCVHTRPRTDLQHANCWEGERKKKTDSAEREREGEVAGGEKERENDRLQSPLSAYPHEY